MNETADKQAIRFLLLDLACWALSVHLKACSPGALVLLRLAGIQML